MTNETHRPGRGDAPADADRRALLKAGGGLVIAFTWLEVPSRALAFASGKAQAGDAAAARADGDPAFAPNAFVRIGTDGVVRLVMPQVEVGQGSYTGQATLLAEELCVDLDQVRVEHAPPNEALYGFELQEGQITGTSNAMRATWTVLREAGAVARMMLVSAAAARWGVSAEQCRVERGIVHHAPSGRALPYGQLASAAAHQPVPEKPDLLSAAGFRLIGRPLKRIDAPAKTDGSLAFGIDVRVPGMRVAALETAPTVGGRVRRVDDVRARAVPGVVDVVVLGDAVAVIAADFWTARKGVAALAIDWDAGAHATLSSEHIAREMETVSRSGRSLVAKEVGPGAVGTARRVEAIYTLPMLAHAALEPMSAVVSVRKDGCDIWAGTQIPTRVVDVATRITGLPADKIAFHPQYSGGSFGRRLETDSVEQALEIGRRVGYPVKVIWTREQDIALDYFRPPYHDHLVATLDDKGYPATWWKRGTSDAVTERWSPADMGKDGLDPDCVDGAIEPPYALPHLRVEWARHRLPAPVRTGWWRGVGQTHNLFPVECFIDELAHAAHQDPVAYRRALLASNPRARAVLDLAAEKFGWGAPVGARVGCGVALGMPMATYICAIVEVEVSPQGQVRLRRAVAAVDCGTVINPDTIAAQVQGGLIFGWSAALHGEITLRDGAVEQQNFNDYRVLRIGEVPRIDVHAVPSREPPTGIGEPPAAIAAPCLANAIFAATGVRVRRLPIARTMLAASPSSLNQVVT
ncbi:MAG: xanthine dehydrogenase family protein molybdopterin-binding subunit [Proteobacteria bacterium]|nr:xanthine dehydrogenase family protein molybdopterin-binding subunit [Pseudomonadota bacterium]